MRPDTVFGPTLIRNDGALALYPKVGVPVRLSLHLPRRAGFSGPDHRGPVALNVGRFVVRAPGGLQESLAAAQIIDTRESSHVFRDPGAAMVMLCLGPDGGTASNAWQRVTYCNKTVYRVADEHGQLPEPLEDPGIMTKAGLSIEVLPIMSPLLVRPGDDFAVRIYLHGKAQSLGHVRALRPDGSVDEQISNRIGLARFRITEAGRWVIRFVGSHGGREAIGELVFDVEAESPTRGAR
ncbi:MAG: hypothetical protein V3V08_05980 [Nannocystaceae bacterium]